MAELSEPSDSTDQPQKPIVPIVWDPVPLTAEAETSGWKGIISAVFVVGIILIKVFLLGAFNWGCRGREEQLVLQPSTAAPNRVRVWDSQTGQVVVDFTIRAGALNDVGLNENGTVVAAAVMGTTGSVRVWRDGRTTTLAGLPDATQLRRVTVSRDGKRVAAADALGRAWVWEVASPRTPSLTIPAVPEESSTPTIGFVGRGSDVLLLLGNTRCQLWHVAPPGKRVLEFDQGPLWAAATPSRLAVSQRGNLEVWDWNAGVKIASMNPPPGLTFKRVQFVAGGQQLAAALSDQTIRVFDIATHKELLTLQRPLRDVTAMEGGDGGRRLYVLDGETVEAWDPATGKRVGTFPTQPGDGINRLSRYGPYLVGTREKGAVVWKVPPAAGEEPGSGDGTRLWTADEPLTWYRDGTRVVRGNVLLDPETGTVRTELSGTETTKPPTGILFSANGKRLTARPR